MTVHDADRKRENMPRYMRENLEIIRYIFKKDLGFGKQ